MIDGDDNEFAHGCYDPLCDCFNDDFTLDAETLRQIEVSAEAYRRANSAVPDLSLATPYPAELLR